MRLKSTLIYLLIFVININAQISERTLKQIDSLFFDWDKPNHPGGTVGVMKDGKIFFSKAFGLASLEYLVPNNAETLFNIGSISKQFTAMGIIILHEQGKLSFDDDYRKYLPELPGFEQIITIRHLLHHTSGLRSLHDLLALAGWRGDDFRTNDDLMRFMKKQRDLNFNPGNEFSYCNTGYVLLAEMIERITGENFTDWMKKTIFEPLGMYNTYVEDNYQRIVHNNATSYYYSHDDVFERAVEFWGYTGAGNIHSNTNDLLVWSRNYYDPLPNWENRFILLETLDTLNNGEPHNYAFGIFVDEKFGYQRVQHAGVIGGYRSFLSVYPEEKLNFVVLANFSSAPFGEYSDKIAKLILPAREESYIEKEEGPNDESTIKADTVKKYSSKEMLSYTGVFYSSEIETQYKIYLKNDNLMWHHARHGDYEIEIISKDVLKGNWPLELIRISRNDADMVNGIFVSNKRVKKLWFRKLKVDMEY